MSRKQEAVDDQIGVMMSRKQEAVSVRIEVASPATALAVEEARVTCTSHDVYLAVADAMAVSTKTTITVFVTNASGTNVSEIHQSADEVTQSITLIVIGILSFLLLVIGTQFMTSVLAITTFVVTFWLVYGVFDSLEYDANRDHINTASFSYCVLPFVLAVLCGLFASALSLCLAQREAWIGASLLGAQLGAVIMYIIRDIAIAVHPILVDDPYFAWYWLIVVIIMLIFGVLGAYLKSAIFAVTAIVIGAYGFAIFVSGLVTTLGGGPIGAGYFICIIVLSAAVGTAVQYYQKHRERPEVLPPGKHPPMG